MGDGLNPRLAGQSRGYMLKPLQEFNGKTRGTNPWMSDILGGNRLHEGGTAVRIVSRALLSDAMSMASESACWA